MGVALPKFNIMLLDVEGWNVSRKGYHGLIFNHEIWHFIEYFLYGNENAVLGDWPNDILLNRNGLFSSYASGIEWEERAELFSYIKTSSLTQEFLKDRIKSSKIIKLKISCLLKILIEAKMLKEFNSFPDWVLVDYQDNKGLVQP